MGVVASKGELLGLQTFVCLESTLQCGIRKERRKEGNIDHLVVCSKGCGFVYAVSQQTFVERESSQ